MNPGEHPSEIERAATAAAPSDYVRAMRSLYRTDGEDAGDGRPSALDIAFERLAGELRLFPPDDTHMRPRLIVGEFELRKQIGVGGMGAVYLAWSRTLSREVALKILHIAFEGSRQGERLLREARALAKVKHPNVVHIYQIDGAAAWALERPKEEPGPEEQGQTSIIVMEYVDGPTLADWLRTRRGWREILDVFLHLARGLAAAHRCGLLHCDITPRNILVDAAGTAKLIDFGLSRQSDAPSGESQSEGHPSNLSRSSVRADAPLWSPVHIVRRSCGGTPGYASPEQLQRRGTIDARSDVFGLCVTLWQALSGSLPYAADSLNPRTAPDEIHVPHLRSETWPSDVPKWLRDLLIRGLSFDPGQRPPNMGILVAELEAHLVPPRPWLPWLTSFAAVLALLALVLLRSRPEPLPFPLGEDDPGIEQDWNDRRASTLAAALTGPRDVPDHLRSELLRAIDEYVAQWNDLRESGRHGLVAQWPRDGQQRFGACLVAARHDFARILRAIETHTAAPRQGTALQLALHPWLVGLRPPTHCADPDYVSTHDLDPRTVLTLGSAPGDDWNRLYSAGYEHFLAGRFEHARYWLRKALAAAGTDPADLARSHFRLALVERELAGPAVARVHLREALQYAEAARDTYLRFYTLKYLLADAAADPDGTRGADLYKSALGLLRSIGRAGATASTAAEESALHLLAARHMAGLAARTGTADCPLDCPTPDHDRTNCDATCVDALLDQAVRVAPTDRERARAWLTRAELALQRHDLDTADQALRRAGALASDVDALGYTVWLHETLAYIAVQRDRNQDAETSLRLAHAGLAAEGRADSLDAARVARSLAVLRLADGDPREACELAGHALAILDRHGLTGPRIPEAIELLEVLGRAYTTNTAVRDDARGIRSLRRAIDLASGIEFDAAHLQRLVSIHILLARAVLRRDARQEAELLLESAARLLPRAESPELALEVLLLRAEIDLDLGAYPTARRRLADATPILYTLSPPPRELELHHRWLSARLAGDLAEAHELAVSVADALDTAPELIDDLLDPHAIRAWLSKHNAKQKRGSHGPSIR